MSQHTTEPVIVIAVINARPGAGASMTAAALADVGAQLVDDTDSPIPTALIDLSPPYAATDLGDSSGLANAAAVSTGTPVLLRVGQRKSGAGYVGLDCEDRSRAAGVGAFFGRQLVPNAETLLQAANGPRIVVLDTSWSVAEGFAGPRDQFVRVLSDPAYAVYPIVVTPATQPCVAAAEGILEALATTPASPAQIVIPAAMEGAPEALHAAAAIAPRVAKALAAKPAVAIPYDTGVAFAGVPAEFPPAIFNAAFDVLTGCGALNAG